MSLLHKSSCSECKKKDVRIDHYKKELLERKKQILTLKRKLRQINKLAFFRGMHLPKREQPPSLDTK